MLVTNGGIADFYVVFARSADEPGARGISAFLVEADAPGLSMVSEVLNQLTQRQAPAARPGSARDPDPDY